MTAFALGLRRLGMKNLIQNPPDWVGDIFEAVIDALADCLLDVVTGFFDSLS